MVGPGELMVVSLARPLFSVFLCGGGKSGLASETKLMVGHSP